MVRNQQEWDWDVTLLTQGDTGTPSVVKIRPKQSGTIESSKIFAVRAQVCNAGGFTDATNATIAGTTNFADLLVTNTATKDLTLKSNAGVQATETLTISGVVIDGETFTTSTRVYEFDDNSSVTGSNVAADISSYSTASQCTLTIAEQATASDDFNVAGQSYICVTGTATTPGEVGLGADEAAFKVNVVAAINGTDGINAANGFATAAAFSGDDCVITAINPGTAGDALVCTETFTDVGNVFDAATFGTTTAGVDCTAANAVLAAVAAVNADGSAVVTGVDGTGDVMDVTAVTAGTAANSFATTETMVNGAWGDTTMSGGIDSVPGEVRVSVTDATVESWTLRLGPPNILALPANYSDSSITVAHAAP